MDNLNRAFKFGFEFFHMGAPSQVLFALHNTLEPRGFENLCVDLLYREGYSRIVPGGKSRDHGRDAETRYWIDPEKGLPQVAFQFSMARKWEPKLRKDIATILKNCTSLKRIVFVSNQSITVEKQDKLRLEFLEKENIVLEILDEGWFRIRLEEDHVDLSKKYLGVETEEPPGFHVSKVILYGLNDDNQAEVLRNTSPETLRATLTGQVKADPSNSRAWKGLASVCYYQKDYENALIAISKALALCDDEAENWNLISLKASIIAEQGVETGSRLLLRKAKALFTPFIERLGRWVDHYNLANIYGALNEGAKAEFHYRKTLELDPKYAPAWKNLGSLLFKLNRPEEGMDCLNRALEIDPNLLEALCTKANVLVMEGGDCSEALMLMEHAFKIDPDLERRWPHAHYWYAMALCRKNRFEDALKVVEERLERKFDCPFLGRLATDILGQLWRSDDAYLARAEEFFTLRIDSRNRDYRALSELLYILSITNRESEAWSFVNLFLGLKELSFQRLAARVPISISDLAESFGSIEEYRGFRESSPLADYGRILEESELDTHQEVPSAIFHLLVPAYFQIASKIQDPEADEAAEIEAVVETYKLVSTILASVGGALLSSKKESEVKVQSELIAKAILLGQDIPLMEISRLIGYLFGVSMRELPEKVRDVAVETTSSIHEKWIEKFLEAVGEDWGIEQFKFSRDSQKEN